MQRTFRLLSLAIAVLLTSCTGTMRLSLNGQPDFDVTLLLPPGDVDTLSKAHLIEPLLGWQPVPECDNAYASKLSDQPTRDGCVKALISLIDVQYAQYREALLRSVDEGDLTVDLATLGLGSAGALVPGKTTKSILAAISADLVGTKGFINSDVLYNSTIFVIINQMDTDRANQRCVVYNELKNPVPQAPPSVTANTSVTLTTATTITTGADGTLNASAKVLSSTAKSTPQPYTMYDASADLILYYQAGTFSHAMQSLQAKTGSQATAAKQQAATAKTGGTTGAGSPTTSGSSGSGSSSGTCSSP